LTAAFPADGYLLLRKRPGETSFAALARVKRRCGTSRVGHCGTLDKFAEGLLVVLVGRATRLVPYFTSAAKEYEALIRFGVETATLDPDGEVVATAGIPSLSDLEAALPSFRGPILQRPPEYSAVHVDGKRAYKRVLAGETVELPARPVTVDVLELVAYAEGIARIRVVCSKGTYIRSLARDIALAAGSRAHLTGLIRTASGGFLLSEAVDLSDDAAPVDGAVGADGASGPLWPVRAVDAAACRTAGLAMATADARQARWIRHGRPIEPDWLPLPDNPDTFAMIAEDRLLAVVERSAGQWRYALVAEGPEPA
jgi:tRNA pseudouridine55 synthase